MLRFRSVTSLLAVPAAAALLFLTGCGGDKPPTPSKDGSANTGGGDKGGPKGPLKELESKGTGTVEGKVVFDGTPPVPKPVDFSAKKENEAYCHMGPKVDTTDPLWRVGPDGGVGNVVVWVRAPAGTFFKLSDADKKRTDPVVIRQPFCAFEPHTFVVYPTYFDGTSKTQKPTGQVLKVINDATIAHNSNVDFSNKQLGTGDNKMLAPKSDGKIAEMVFSEISASKPKEAGGVNTATVKCNVHTWMNATGKVLDHPFFAVTKGGGPEDKEFGTYKIENVPAGTELELVYWHESMGPTEAPKVLKKIKVEDGKTVKVDDIKIK
jgi:hypothetical protein